MSMTVLDRQLARLVHVVATVQGFRGSGVQGFTRTGGGSTARAISVAVKPIDVSPLSYVLSYTLCVIHAHTLEARTVPVWLTLDTKCL